MSACPLCNDQLLDRAYGELSDAERRDLDRHLEGSESCRDAFAALVATVGLVRPRGDDGPSAALVAGLKAEARKYCTELRVDARQALRRRQSLPRNDLHDGLGAGVFSRSIPLWASILAASVAIFVAGLAFLRSEAEPAGQQLADSARPQSAPGPARLANDSIDLEAGAKQDAIGESSPSGIKGERRMEQHKREVEEESVGGIERERPPSPSAAGKFIGHDRPSVAEPTVKAAAAAPSVVEAIADTDERPPWSPILDAAHSGEFVAANAAYERWRATLRSESDPGDTAQGNAAAGELARRRLDDSRPQAPLGGGRERRFARPPQPPQEVEAFYASLFQALQESASLPNAARGSQDYLNLLMRLVDDAPPLVATEAAGLALPLAAQLGDASAADRARRQLDAP